MCDKVYMLTQIGKKKKRPKRHSKRKLQLYEQLWGLCSAYIVTKLVLEKIKIPWMIQSWWNQIVEYLNCQSCTWDWEATCITSETSIFSKNIHYGTDHALINKFLIISVALRASVHYYLWLSRWPKKVSLSARNSRHVKKLIIPWYFNEVTNSFKAFGRQVMIALSIYNMTQAIMNGLTFYYRQVPSFPLWIYDLAVFLA